MNDVPAPYRQAGTLMMVAGMLDICWGLVWSGSLCLSTFSGVLCGPICCFIPLFQAIGGIGGLYVGWQVSQGEPVPWAQRYAMGSAVFSAMNFAVLMMGAHLVATVLLGDDRSRAWLAEQEAALQT